MPQIKMRVSKTGEVRIVTEGFAGAACENALEALEKRLGPQVEKEYTPEYYAEAKPEVEVEQKLVDDSE